MKKPAQKVAYLSRNLVVSEIFHLLPTYCPTAQMAEFMFQNVVYRATVYRTGCNTIMPCHYRAYKLNVRISKTEPAISYWKKAKYLCYESQCIPPVNSISKWHKMSASRQKTMNSCNTIYFDTALDT